MGIRILYVEAVVPIDPIPPVDINLNQINNTPLRALVFPGITFLQHLELIELCINNFIELQAPILVSRKP